MQQKPLPLRQDQSLSTSVRPPMKQGKPSFTFQEQISGRITMEDGDCRAEGDSLRTVKGQRGLTKNAATSKEQVYEQGVLSSRAEAGEEDILQDNKERQRSLSLEHQDLTNYPMKSVFLWQQQGKSQEEQDEAHQSQVEPKIPEDEGHQSQAEPKKSEIESQQAQEYIYKRLRPLNKSSLKSSHNSGAKANSNRAKNEKAADIFLQMDTECEVIHNLSIEQLTVAKNVGRLLVAKMKQAGTDYTYLKEKIDILQDQIECREKVIEWNWLKYGILLAGVLAVILAAFISVGSVAGGIITGLFMLAILSVSVYLTMNSPSKKYHQSEKKLKTQKDQ